MITAAYARTIRNKTPVEIYEVDAVIHKLATYCNVFNTRDQFNGRSLSDSAKDELMSNGYHLSIDVYDPRSITISWGEIL